MMQSKTELIQAIGQTDQLFLMGNTPQLAYKRAKLRLNLIKYSQQRNEQLYFLQEAIVILEQARLEFDDIALELYLDLSILLAEAYLCYFKIEQKNHFATIIQQILKPLSHYPHADIYYYLSYASAIKQEHALTQHWLKKYFQTTQADLERILTPTIFQPYQQEAWWSKLLKSKLN